MKSMDKLTTGVAYGTSAGSAGYWFLQLLDKVTPSQWAAIGVLGIKGACDQLRRWTYAGGKQWKGLMTRREIEREVCLWGQQ